MFGIYIVKVLVFFDFIYLLVIVFRGLWSKDVLIAFLFFELFKILLCLRYSLLIEVLKFSIVVDWIFF